MSSSSPPKESSGVRFPPPLYYAGALGAGFLVQRRWPVPILPGHPAAARAAGVALILLGAALALAAVLTFRRAGTSPNPTKPTTALALAGPYRWTRNPMYLGLALGSAGVATAFNALWPLLLIPVAIVLVTRLVIAREERYLERKFGDEYGRYVARVRRWI